jgi:hypothetical protein
MDFKLSRGMIKKWAARCLMLIFAWSQCVHATLVFMVPRDVATAIRFPCHTRPALADVVSQRKRARILSACFSVYCYM